MGITKLTKNLILERMNDLGIKQVNIAKMLGASTSSVSNWVNGIYDPSSSELPKLLQILKLSIINGEIVKNNNGIEVPIINISKLTTSAIKSKSSTYLTKEENIEYIIKVDTHNFLFPYGSSLYIKKFNGVNDFKNNMLVIIENDNKELKIEKLSFFNNTYYLSCKEKLKSVTLINIKHKISLVKFDDF